jgi:hypothetical protein
MRSVISVLSSLIMAGILLWTSAVATLAEDDFANAKREARQHGTPSPMAGQNLTSRTQIPYQAYLHLRPNNRAAVIKMGSKNCPSVSSALKGAVLRSYFVVTESSDRTSYSI